ncbi:hypothetical protein [Pseudomonas oryzihabitans]|uniref:hypothetical protein n=1 Tax=Pseudomonas oryzihabitans TaxID=47885 RepID=UPI0011A16A22|nr:hypothetical protein [Pseudomonas oryzihabitans]
MSIKDGGTAFPVPGLQNDEDFNGMSLRDYFAAKAMPIAFDSQALLAAGEELGAKQGVALCAKMAWAIADAMLAAREVQS